MNIKFNILSVRPKIRIDRPEGQLRAQVFDFITSQKFEIFILSAITANMFVFGMVHSRMTAGFQAFICKNLINQFFTLLAFCNVLFLIIFTIEAGLKIFAIRKEYFQDSWNRFDFSIVCISYLSFILAFFIDLGGLGSTLSVFRAFRIMRVFKLFDKAK